MSRMWRTTFPPLMTIAVVTSLSPQSMGLRRNYDVKIIIFFVSPPPSTTTKNRRDEPLGGRTGSCGCFSLLPAKADMPMVTADEFNTLLCAIRPKGHDKSRISGPMIHVIGRR
jgi:hypothetical protein